MRFERSRDSRRADLAGVAWTYLALAPQGGGAVVVPESFRSEATQGHLHLRRLLTEEGRVHGIVRLASGAYKPRSNAAVLVLGPPDMGPVWFCEVVDPAEMPQPGTEDATVSPVGKQWRDRHLAAADRPRTGPSFVVPRNEIAAAHFDWSIERFRSAESTPPIPLRPPHEILAELAGLEAEIFQGIRELVGVMKR
jgi:type I restriction enzyme M protein